MIGTNRPSSIEHQQQFEDKGDELSIIGGKVTKAVKNSGDEASPEFLKALDFFRAVLVDLRLQCCVEIRYSTSGLGGGSHLQEPEGVFQL